MSVYSLYYDELRASLAEGVMGFRPGSGGGVGGDGGVSALAACLLTCLTEAAEHLNESNCARRRDGRADGGISRAKA